LKIDDDLSLEKKWEYLKKFLERIRSWCERL
jgi:hypothetical protein